LAWTSVPEAAVRSFWTHNEAFARSSYRSPEIQDKIAEKSDAARTEKTTEKQYAALAFQIVGNLRRKNQSKRD
jgi:hypothetical protein